MLNNNITSCYLRLDKSCIFLPDPHTTDAKSLVSGEFSFNVSRLTAIKGISVVLQGRAKLPYNESTFFKSYYEEITLEQNQPLASSKKSGSFSLPAGSYQLPFKIHLERNALETISGSGHQYHSYEVYGVIERRLSRDIVVSKPIRIYNPVVMLMDGPLTSASYSLEGQWDDKAHYRITIPETNIPFGSTFPVELFLAPLSKGLRLGATSIQVLETHEIRIPAPASYSGYFNVNFLTFTTERLLFNECHDHPGDYTTREGAFEVEWISKKQVCLPQNLEAATQGVKTRSIKISHALTFTIELWDSNGKLSVIQGKIPISIVMSPLTIMENSTVCGLELGRSQSEIIPPPPLYEDHNSDFLLFGIPRNSTACTGTQDFGADVGRVHDGVCFEPPPAYDCVMSTSDCMTGPPTIWLE